MSQVKIRTALEKRINVWATTKSYPVGWENVGGEFDSTHLRVFVFPSPVLNPSLGIEHRRYRGILRIQVYVPTEITGLETESQALARIDRQIPDDYFLLYDKVTMTNSTPYITEIEYKGWKRTGAYMPIATALSMFLN